MEEISVKLVNKSKHQLTPEYKTKFSSGVDLRADLGDDDSYIRLKPLERALIPTGLFIELPEGYEAQVRPRSGLSYTEGLVSILGTIDSDYRGEIKIIVVNLSNKDIIIHDGDRIAQLVCMKVEKMKFKLVDDVNSLSSTDRGTGGIGHSGVK